MEWILPTYLPTHPPSLRSLEPQATSNQAGEASIPQVTPGCTNFIAESSLSSLVGFGHSIYESMPGFSSLSYSVVPRQGTVYGRSVCLSVCDRSLRRSESETGHAQLWGSRV